MYDPITLICEDTEDEAANLAAFFTMLHEQRNAPRIWTFNGNRYDLPLLVTRARALRVPHPAWDIRKYSTGELVDVWDKLTWGGTITNVMGHSLGAFCRRYQIEHDDTVKGSDTAALIAKGDYATVAKHCADDVRATAQLAQEVLGLRGPAVVIDTETVPIEDVERFLSEPKANGTYKDPVKIAEDIAKKKAAQREEAALDVHLARIVVLGYWFIPAEASVFVCGEEELPI